jgi:hypothetical protein
VPLDTFLFDDRTGYCQQFSGAMALLLRMGGVPARVAAGFTPGTFDSERGEYIVRDLDAHSWVEAYFPGSGWVTFDPTPSEAPPAAQLQADDEDQDLPELPGAGRDPGGAPDLGPAFPTRAARPPRAAAGPPRCSSAASASWPSASRAGRGRSCASPSRAGGGPGPRRPAPRPRAVGPAAAAGRHPPGARVVPERLRRAGLRAGAAPVAVRGQLRAAAALGRAALRRELGAGLGTIGRLRAWWALPPRP